MNDVDNHPFTGHGPETPGPTSWTLLDGVKRGHHASCERLVNLYGPLVLNRYLNRVPEQDAMDLFQDIFLTVFRKIDDFERRREGRAFRPWVHRIARNKIGDYVRRLRTHPRAVGGDDGLAFLERLAADSGGDGPTASDEAREQAMVCRRALEMVRAEFEPATWEAAIRLVEGEPVASVAAALGKSPNAVRIARSRVLGQVRDLLQGLGERIVPAAPDAPDHDHG